MNLPALLDRALRLLGIRNFLIGIHGAALVWQVADRWVADGRARRRAQYLAMWVATGCLSE